MTTTIMISTRVKPLVLRVLVFMRMDDFKRPRLRALMSLNGSEVSLAKDFHSQRNVKTLVPPSTEHRVVSAVLRRKKTIKLLSFNAIRLRSHR